MRDLDRADEEPETLDATGVFSAAGVAYDSDGFPVVGDAASLKSGQDSHAEPDVFPAPINPMVKSRKAAALAVTPKKAVKSGETNSSIKIRSADVKLFRPKLHISAHANVRVELCAVDSEGKRVFIFGSTLSAYGETLVKDSQALSQFISEHEGISKDEALQFRDKLRSKSKSSP